MLPFRLSLQAVYPGSIEKPHDTLDHRDIGIGGDAGEQVFHVFMSHHPAVKIVAGSPRSDGKVYRVKKIGADLKGLNTESPTAKGDYESKGESSFAKAAVRSSNDEPGTRNFHFLNPMPVCALFLNPFCLPSASTTAS